MRKEWLVRSTLYVEPNCLSQQAEQEVAKLQRQIRRLEEDLDEAEDRATESTTMLREQQLICEELERQNKLLQYQIDNLESKFVKQSVTEVIRVSD